MSFPPRPSLTPCSLLFFLAILLKLSFCFSPVSSALPDQTSFIHARMWSAYFRPGTVLRSWGFSWWLLKNLLSLLHPSPLGPMSLLYIWRLLMDFALSPCLLFSLIFPGIGNILPKLDFLLVCLCMFYTLHVDLIFCLSLFLSDVVCISYLLLCDKLNFVT